MIPAEDRLLANCRTGEGSLAPLFFSFEPVEIARAKAICAECPIRRPCLSGAISRAEPYGVWGGQLFVDGRIVAHKRGRGRPRKVQPACGGGGHRPRNPAGLGPSPC